MKYLVIADIHGNATALRAVLAKERSFDSVIFLGDTVLAGPQPNETMDILRGLAGVFLMGNHDGDLLNPEGLKVWPSPWPTWFQWKLDTLTPENYAFMEHLSEPQTVTLDGVDFYLHHGDFDDLPHYLSPWLPDDALIPLLPELPARTVLCGHAHVQFEHRVGNVRFVNPGSVGQPRSGKLFACYALITDGEITFHHLAYDPADWLAAMDAIEPLHASPEFVSNYKQALLTGYGVGKQEPWTTLAGQGYF